MRLRNIPRAAETVAASPFVVQEPEALRGQWRRYFENDGALHVEVGMGKGRFLMEMAARHPEVNYIGLERYTSVLLRAVEKREAWENGELQNMELSEVPASGGLRNLLFVCRDAACLPELFASGEVERIYLNFSDPWPKERHAARRLTSPAFLRRYERILAKDGTVEFKTDNQGLFDFSLKSAKESGWLVAVCTRDLHHDAMNAGNVMTEYEEKFAARGNPICKMVLRQKPG